MLEMETYFYTYMSNEVFNTVSELAVPRAFAGKYNAKVGDFYVLMEGMLGIHCIQTLSLHFIPVMS